MQLQKLRTAPGQRLSARVLQGLVMSCMMGVVAENTSLETLENVILVEKGLATAFPGDVIPRTRAVGYPHRIVDDCWRSGSTGMWLRRPLCHGVWSNVAAAQA